MSKYIDADKLIAVLERQNADKKVIEPVIRIITSLQQEQLVNKDLGTLIACDIIEMTVKKVIDKPQDKEKEEESMTRKINYLRSLEENYVQQAQQEQPEVDLEKEIGHWLDKLDDKYCMLVEDYSILDINDTARHFYELGRLSNK